MRCRACIIKGVPIRNVTAVRDDPDVSGFISKAGGELGEKGRFVLRFSEIPEKSQVLVEAPREALCKKYEIPIVLNTEAHYAGLVGKTPIAEQLLRDLDFPEKLIVNLDAERVMDMAHRKRGIVFTEETEKGEPYES